MSRLLGESSGISRVISSLRTTACTTADRKNPRISAQVISHVIDPAAARACPSAARSSIGSLLHGGWRGTGPVGSPSVIPYRGTVSSPAATEDRHRGADGPDR